MNHELEWACLCIAVGAFLSVWTKNGQNDLKKLKEVLPIVLGMGLVGLVTILAAALLWKVVRWIYSLLVAG
jgi:hypothetical protein